MEPLAIVSFLLSAGSIAVAAVVAVIVGRRRGIDQVEDKADGEVKRLVEAQAGRLAILEAENRRLTAEVAALSTELAKVKAELDIERRVTARERERNAADGK
mgnify:CR=1 FL=1